MADFTIALIVISFWATLYFFDIFLKSCMNYPYIWFLNYFGVTIKPGYLRCYTSKLNNWFKQFQRRKYNKLSIWFDLGAAFSLMILIPSVLLLIWTAKHYVFISKSIETETPMLTPMLPGFNIPLEEIFYYFITILLCSVIHEIGHAVASNREGLDIKGVGFFILGVLPAAYVGLSVEHLQQLTPWQQLKIFCAGVWHNIVLVFASGLLLLIIPTVFAIGYNQNSGVLITHIQSNSPVLGVAGLNVKDQITGIRDCSVANTEDWYNCLIFSKKSLGYCSDFQSISKFRENNMKILNVQDCCPSDKERKLCFKVEDSRISTKYMCLPAREVISKAAAVCNSSADCFFNAVCLVPLLDAGMELIQLKRKGKDVIFLGTAAEIYQTVTVSNYIPKWQILPSTLPTMLETTCRYVISFSGALAILNVIPCYTLDGQWILQAALLLIFRKFTINMRYFNPVFVSLMMFGSILLTVTVVYGFWNLIQM